MIFRRISFVLIIVFSAVLGCAKEGDVFLRIEIRNLPWHKIQIFDGDEYICVYTGSGGLAVADKQTRAIEDLLLPPPFKDGRRLPSEIVMYGDDIFVATETSADLMCYDKQKHDFRWQLNHIIDAESMKIVETNLLVLGSEFLSVDIGKGKIQWIRKPLVASAGSIVINRTDLIVQGEDVVSGIGVVSARTGEDRVVFQYPFENPKISVEILKCLVNGEYVYSVCREERHLTPPRYHIVSFNKESGAAEWITDLGQFSTEIHVLDRVKRNRIVCVATGWIGALDASSGNVVWSSDWLSNMLQDIPSDRIDGAFAVFNEGCFSLLAGQLSALDLSSGREIWHTFLGSGDYGIVGGCGDRLCVVTEGGGLVQVFDAAEGTLLKTIDTGMASRFRTSFCEGSRTLVTDGNNIFYVGNDKILYGISIE